MALINLTVGGSVFSLDENNIVRVYEVSSIVMVDYLDLESKYKKTILVAESLATIAAASTTLIQVTNLDNGGSILINSNFIISVVSNGSGATISYDVNGALAILEVTESKSMVVALIPAIGGVESGTFTLNAAGTAVTGTGVTLITPGEDAVVRIATTKKMKLAFFHALDDGEYQNGSRGQSDGLIQSCIFNNTVIFIGFDHKFCIIVGDNINGWEGQVLLANITDTYFDIAFAREGAGVDITGQYHLQT